MSVIIDASELHKIYRAGPTEVHALRGVSLQVERGEFLAVMGPSGSGKSTLLHILGCLDRPTSGTYRFDGTDVRRLSDRQMARLRNRRIGFVFQSFNLLPRETALENVTLPLLYAGERKLRERGLRALEMVGLADRAHHYPGQLSGGEQQRVAIARALVKEPDVILADEPTGNLDSRTTEDILDLFHQAHERGITIVIITHNREVAEHAERIIHLRDGMIEAMEPASSPATSVPPE